MPGRFEALKVFLQEITDARVGHVLCLVSDEEIARKSPEYLAAIKGNEIPARLWQFPIPDYGIPENPADLDKILGSIRNCLDDGKSVVIHCAAGIGRTGTVSTLLLIRMGMLFDQAIESIRLAGSAPETPEQHQFLKIQSTGLKNPILNLQSPRDRTIGKIALLSDIHSNLPAFKAVLREVQESGAERIVFLGDIVGYGASPAECVDIVRNLGGHCVMGNHDMEIRDMRKHGCTFQENGWQYCGYQAGLAHSAKCLDASQAEWLAALPFGMKIPGAFVAHGSLNEPKAFNYIQDGGDAEPTLEILREEEIDIGFFGHTHVPDIFTEDVDALEWLDTAQTQVRIPSGLACAITVGAVGQPRHETDRRAAWVLWDPEEGVVEFRKTDYDRLEAAKDIIKAGLPLESALRLLTDQEAAVFTYG
jgi:protein-tyrosine phosphatase/predicted phosphodiesterase